MGARLAPSNPLPPSPRRSLNRRQWNTNWPTNLGGETKLGTGTASSLDRLRAMSHVACVTRLIISGNFDSVLSKRVSYFFFSFFLLSLDLDTAFWRVNGFLWSYHVSWLCCTRMSMRGDYLSWKKNKRITYVFLFVCKVWIRNKYLYFLLWNIGTVNNCRMI